MAMLNSTIESRSRAGGAPELYSRAWKGPVAAAFDHDRQSCRIQCGCVDLIDMCQWLSEDLGFAFATLIVEEAQGGWSLSYVFYKDAEAPWVCVDVALDANVAAAPSLSGLAYGPSFGTSARLRISSG